MLSPRYWLGVRQETRAKIASFLGISKTGGSEVIGQTVVSDGYTADDLSVITLERLRHELGLTESDDNFYQLFDELVRRLELPPIELDLTARGTETSPFCMHCDSKGV